MHLWEPNKFNYVSSQEPGRGGRLILFTLGDVRLILWCLVTFDVILTTLKPCLGEIPELLILGPHDDVLPYMNTHPVLFSRIHNKPLIKFATFMIFIHVDC